VRRSQVQGSPAVRLSALEWWEPGWRERDLMVAVTLRARVQLPARAAVRAQVRAKLQEALRAARPRVADPRRARWR
jgi:hypothetical protein